MNKLIVLFSIIIISGCSSSPKKPSYDDAPLEKVNKEYYKNG